MAWKKSTSNDVVKYRIYWAWTMFGKPTYSAPFHEFPSSTTSVIIPDKIPELKLKTGVLVLGVSSIDAAGNESNVAVAKPFYLLFPKSDRHRIR